MKTYREIFDEWFSDDPLVSKNEIELCEDFCTYLDGYFDDELNELNELLKKFNETSSDEKIHNMAECMLSILDYLKLQDNCTSSEDDMLTVNNETLSEMMFRKMKAYNINLNKELGFTHLKPIKK